MRIIFINPPNINEIKATLPSFVGEEKGVTPPLGILSLASHIKKNTTCEVFIIDAQVEGYSYDELGKVIQRFNADMICITVLSMTVRDVVKTIELSRKVSPTSKIVLGGPHVSCYPVETAMWKGVDLVIHGEGEEVLTQLITELQNNGDISKLKGLVYVDEDGELVNNGRASYIQDLDSLPFPDRTLIPYEKYASIIMRRIPVTSLLSSRGCPFQCNYCNRATIGKKFRARGVQHVINEIEHCLHLGIKSFIFYDDTFTINRNRAIEICKTIIKSRFNIEFNIRSRVDTIDDEMLFYFKKAGCVGIHYGVESGSQKVLERINKGITLEKVIDTINLTKKHKIKSMAYFMFGNPGETMDDTKETVQFMDLIDPDYVMISIFTPFPGTKSYVEGLKLNLYDDTWKKLAEDPLIDVEMPVWTENFSKEQLMHLMNNTYRKFYFDKKRVIRQIFRIRNINNAARNVRVAFKMLVSRW